MRITQISEDSLDKALPHLAQLRLVVFSDFPYLYKGGQEYEHAYLRNFAQSRDAVIVSAMTDNGDIVGCATGSALSAHHAEFSQPLAEAGLPIGSTFYFGESVLYENYRGLGIGHAFFDYREAHAKERGYKRICFCGVDRAPDDPRMPDNHRSLEGFWVKRGYSKVNGVKSVFKWPEETDGPQIPHEMTYWLREL